MYCLEKHRGLLRPEDLRDAESDTGGRRSGQRSGEEVERRMGSLPEGCGWWMHAEG